MEHQSRVEVFKNIFCNIFYNKMYYHVNKIKVKYSYVHQNKENDK